MDTLICRKEQFKEGDWILSLGEDPGMDTDLVFARASHPGEPLWERQSAMLDYIVRAVEALAAQEA